MRTDAPQRGWKLVVKVLLERFIAAILLILLAPFLLVLGVLVWRKMGWPVIFSQLRPGRYCRPFRILKFRTMKNATDPQGRLLPDAERLTGLGRFLRSTSLDELPELWNVWCGELSLVGPRPLRMGYLSRYTFEQNRRHQVLPGITGWAQVNGRNAISWERKFELDVWYVDHWSLWLDFWILCRTFWAVARRQAISSGDHVTMPEFMGSDQSEERTPRCEQPD
jgi:sugar transferase EpsL